MKKKRLCSSCHPSSGGRCRNVDCSDSGAGSSSISGSAAPASSLTQLSRSSSVNELDDAGADDDGSLPSLS